jgi:hypothetical protein
MEFAVHIRWIHGMNLFVYWENAEWICSCTENMWNESIYAEKWEYAKCTKSRIPQQIQNQNQKYFETFISCQDGYVWPNHSKPKNLTQVYSTFKLTSPNPGMRQEEICKKRFKFVCNPL